MSRRTLRGGRIGRRSFRIGAREGGLTRRQARRATRQEVQLARLGIAALRRGRSDMLTPRVIQAMRATIPLGTLQRLVAASGLA